MSVRFAFGVAAAAVVTACGSAQHSDAPTSFGYPAVLRDTVFVDSQTWFLFGPETSRSEELSTICTLVASDLTCARVPASKHGVRLVEPGPGASALIALAMGEDTLYVEPFTWKTIRYLESVSFERHAVVLRDGTLWIEQDDNLLVIPRSGAPRRIFEKAVEDVSVSPAGVTWVVYRGPNPRTQTPVLFTARIEGERLAPARERPDVGVWAAGRGLDVCHVGTTVGLIDHHARELVRFDLETDEVSRIRVGDGVFIRCGPGAVAATPLLWSTTNENVASWCNRTGCRTHATRLPLPHYLGAFTVIDHSVFAVGSGLETLVSWKVGERPQLVDLRGSGWFSVARAAPLPDGGALVLSIHGPMAVFDRHGQFRPVNVRWSGSPFVPELE